MKTIVLCIRSLDPMTVTVLGIFTFGMLPIIYILLGGELKDESVCPHCGKKI